MSERLIIDGNAVYEIDEDCLRQQEARRRMPRQCRAVGEWQNCQEARKKEQKS
ncbi:MAG: hypothetical protein HFG70_04015 [Hungatella sp.]|nr:hypothetical protein [Hungatella sp.]